MREQSLNGVWQYRVGRGAWQEIGVPFSRRPVGYSVCRRSFRCEERTERTYLHLEGITYSARITCNGTVLGEMLPYSPYTYDITDIVRDGDNDLTVELEDISPAFGPSEGWENFGGIIRGVSLLHGRDARICDVFFHTRLVHGYRDAVCTVETETEAQPRDILEICLRDGEGRPVLTVQRPAGEGSGEYPVENVRLWSPEDPQLYGLTVRLLRDGEELDSRQMQVGFREFTCGRHRFYLNGKPCFLRGVCRHEMIGDSGHTPDRAAIEEDMRRIKETGSNFVRLVHYPHCRETLEIADRLGLMVSEEPGLWWSDTSDSRVAEGSLEVLRRTVRRDRSHASIVFWLCFNECRFTEAFLLDAARVCRESDPTRPVSGANCMEDEDTRYYYDLCGFDFYTMHPYAPNFDRAARSARILHDKPLLFSEWGGFFVCENPKLLSDFIHEMGVLWRQNSDEGALAGSLFWCWGEVYDFNRGRPACYDGLLREGLMTAEREPTMIYDAFCRAWAEAERGPVPDAGWYAPCVGDDLPGRPWRCLSPATPATDLLDEAMQRHHAFLGRERPRKLTVGPRLPDGAPAALSRDPWCIREGEEAVFLPRESGENAVLTLIGGVTHRGGYPVSGAYGETVAVAAVTYADGGAEEFPLQNGAQVTTVFTTLSSSRIDPRADRAPRFAEFGYDRNFENYILNRVELPLSRRAPVRELRLRGTAGSLLVYGVFGT